MSSFLKCFQSNSDMCPDLGITDTESDLLISQYIIFKLNLH